MTQTLSAVTSAAIANDLKLRIYFKDEGANAALLSRVAVRFVAYGAHLDAAAARRGRQPRHHARDRGLGPGQGRRHRRRPNATNWPASFTATKYVIVRLPRDGAGVGRRERGQPRVPLGNSAAGTHCFYFEVYDGTTLIGTHGSAPSSGFCTSSTTQATGTISLPEINTPDRANNATVKLFVWGNAKITNFDLVALHHTYQLAPTGCVDAGTIRVGATRDNFVDQANAAVVQGGVDLKVRWTPPRTSAPTSGSRCRRSAAAAR